ncbi:four-helix bundle copper-binding protein [Paraclostridium sp. AKS81]|uniref:four-helix bundle copper-binding protein n=1 Tax=Paraclostridium sp. AKS81 TaxID=2876117 RepID=UPI0021DFCEE5|nr:four-helix bundle copper-binding protein [Paraclostridium sp. AKS81]MCU9813116.1 four-helix bundle copper-binding protein [Paraclostridium sp. AKS81]
MGIVTNKTDKHQACIDECQKCAQACYECLNEPDIKERKNCVSTLVECAMMCQMSVSMMAINGKFSKEHCELCAKICEQCEQECAMFKDDHCQKCASVCRSCADECRKMANM